MSALNQSPLRVASLFDLRGRVVIVTGASAGIGRMLSERLTEEGAHVVMASRRQEVLEALAAAMPSALAVRCDVTVENDRGRLIEQALDRLAESTAWSTTPASPGAGSPRPASPLRSSGR